MRAVVTCFLGCAAVLSACASPDTVDVSQPPPAPASLSPSASTVPPSRVDTVQLLYISDSSGWETAEAYAGFAEAELGVPVELVDWRMANLSMVDVPDDIAANPDVVADAEIVVLWANPFGSGIKEGLAPCFGEAPANEIDRFSVEDWEPFADLTGEVLDAVVAARAGAPTVVRVTDLYVPVMTQWRDRGILEICMAGMETMSDALRMVAAEHGATFVSSLDVYNGPEHQTDPVEAGFIRGDGLHPSAAGGQAMAEALAAVGFEPSPAPTS